MNIQKYEYFYNVQNVLRRQFVCRLYPSKCPEALLETYALKMFIFILRATVNSSSFFANPYLIFCHF